MLNTHKTNSQLHQSSPQTTNQTYAQNRLKHVFEDLLALVLILITISCLSYAATHLLSDRTAINQDTNQANTLVPAIYAHDTTTDELSL